MMKVAIQLILDAANDEDWSTVTALLFAMQEPNYSHADRTYAVRSLVDFTSYQRVQIERERGNI